MRIATNGCFDLLHEGHKHLIDYCIGLAGGEGQVLILVDSDESVKKLKGEGRPKETISVRLDNIWAHIQETFKYLHPGLHQIGLNPYMSVDVFNNDYELLKAFQEFKPHMIVKGSDRPDVRTITGSGEFPVLIVPRLKDEEGLAYSTTRFIEGDE